MDRYSVGAQDRVEELCCPVSYDSHYLEVIPKAIIERDYGCGDPSTFVQPGDTVLDLGSGAGKICFIAAQIVGPQGRVIGVDLNEDMLRLARTHQPEIARRIGYDNVTFLRGRIQDLALDLGALEQHLSAAPPPDIAQWMAIEDECERLRSHQPLVASDSVDIVLSNCVLNLVRNEDKTRLFAELYRVLRSGGRAAISDIVADEPIPEALQNDPELWSGCISGAYEEQAFLDAFTSAGFHGIEIAKRDDAPWRVIHGIEFRSMTVLAHKGKAGPCFEHNQAVVYCGPFSAACDDDGHIFQRGERVAVCDKTFRLLQRAPYRSHFEFIEPRESVDPAHAQPFDCSRTTPRHPRETKGQNYDATSTDSNCCGTDCC
jgi:SAM-dependent methyltransferase